METPTLETPRLLLRGHLLEDFEDGYAMWRDPEVTRHIGGRPFTEQECWTRLLRYVGHWALLGYGYWALIEKRSGRFVGEAGFADFKRAMEPPLEGAPEIGWALASWAHRQGFASEALAAIVGWGDVQLRQPRTVCIIDPANLASIRVAGKLGYQRVAEVSLAGAPVLLFERVAPKSVRVTAHLPEAG